VQEGAAILEAAHANLSGDVAAAMAAAQRALAQQPDEPTPARAIANVHLGMAAYYAGEPSIAQAALEQALQAQSGDEWPSVVVTALGNLASLHLDRGDLPRAERTVADAERAIDEFRVHEAPFACRYWVARGKLLERRAQLPEAEAAFERAAMLARRCDSHLVVAHGLLSLATLRRRRRAHSEARRLVREARQVLSSCKDPGVVGELLRKAERATQLAPARAGLAAVADPELSERELVVLRMLATQLSQREISAELYVSFHTVKSQTRSVFRKLGVRTREDAVARGRELDLI
jgi:LuxR family transcriptional regulator, maltose regulon positive regulatory protein